MYKEYIMSGWIEPANDAEREKVERIALYFMNHDKVGIFKYFESAKIFFMNENQLLPEWIQRLKYKTKKSDQNLCPGLCFIMMFQPGKVPFSQPVLRTIEPEIITSSPLRKKKQKLDRTQKNLERVYVEASVENGVSQDEVVRKGSFNDVHGNPISPIKNIPSSSLSPIRLTNSRDVTEGEKDGEEEGGRKEEPKMCHNCWNSAQVNVKSSPFKVREKQSQYNVVRLSDNEQSMNRKSLSQHFSPNNHDRTPNKIHLRQTETPTIRALERRNANEKSYDCRYMKCEASAPNSTQFSLYYGKHQINQNYCCPDQCFQQVSDFQSNIRLNTKPQRQPDDKMELRVSSKEPWKLKPKTFDPSINPLYQSYLTRKNFERLLPNQIQFSNKPNYAGKNTVNSNFTSKKSNVIGSESAKMVAYVRGISNQHRQRNGFKPKNNNHQH